MRSNKSSFWYFFAATLFILQSCAKENNLTQSFTGFVDTEASLSGDASRVSNEILHTWTAEMLEVERYASGMRPNASARALAYIYLASYETAVPGMSGYGSTENRLQGFQIDGRRTPDEFHFELALNACLADVTEHFMINVEGGRDASIGELEEALEEVYQEGVDAGIVEESKDWGRYVASRVIDYATSDNEAEAQIREPQPTSYEPPTGPGFWTYSASQERALFPYWESVRTFVISSQQTSSRPPIQYSENENSAYYQQMMEVVSENNAARAADGEQLWIAEFWSDDVESLMMSPPARQYAISNQLISQFNLNLEESLVLYLKLGFALNDAAVSTWADKYEYMVMRPNVFIHEHIDERFQTNLFRLVFWPNPSFPGYPSGHSTFASAAGGVFIDFFGNQVNFTDRTHEGRTEFRGTPRTFSSFRQLAEENAFSRVPLGVHMEMDCAEGLRLGYEIADAVNDFELRENPL